MLEHTERMRALKAAGVSKAERAAIHNARVKEQLEAAKSGPINLSDLMAAAENLQTEEV